MLTRSERIAMMVLEAVAGGIGLMLIWDVMGWKVAIGIFFLQWGQNAHNRRTRNEEF